MARTLKAYAPVVLLSVLALMAIPGTILYLLGDFSHSAFESSGGGGQTNWWAVAAMLMILAGLVYVGKSMYNSATGPTKRR